MASLEKRSGKFRVVFRFGGRKFSRALNTAEPRSAAACLARLEDNLRRVSLGILDMPAEVDPAAFLLSDGRIGAKPRATAALSLQSLFNAFFQSLPAGHLEPETVSGMKIHERQLVRRLGAAFQIRRLSLADLQHYVEERAKDKGLRGRKVTATTIKKALVTLRSVWNWGVQTGLLEGPFPQKGIKYPKCNEKPPFQTYAEIERRVKAMPKAQAADLWDCLFLTSAEVDELLNHVKKHSRHPFVYPLFVFAAHSRTR